MKTTALLLLALMTIAGCADTAVDNATADPATDDTEPYAEPCDVAALTIDVPAELQTQNASATLPVEISVSGQNDTYPVLVTLDTEPNVSAEVNGTGSFDVPLDVGRTTVNITADDGCQTVSATSDLVRLAQGTVQVTFRADADGRDDIDDTVWFDISAMPSASMYEGCAMEHPEHATFHDLLVAWSTQTGIVVEYADCTDQGTFVETIDGYASPGYWCYEMDGEAQEVGVSLYEFQDGGVIAFDDCALVLG